MNVREAIISVRDDYVEQFDAMIAHQRAKRSDVYVARKIEQPESNLFGKTYVPDVSFGDPMTEWLDMVPRKRAGALPAFSLNSPNFIVDFEDLWWDDVRFDHDGEFTGKLVSWWFHRWMPPSDQSASRADGVEGFIHSVTVDEKWICIDLGTASIGALFEILSIARNSGAKTGRVTSSRN